MFVACTTFVGGTAANFLVSVISGSVDCCFCGDISPQRVIITLLPQGGNAHGDVLEILSVRALIGECGLFPSFRPCPFP